MMKDVGVELVVLVPKIMESCLACLNKIIEGIAFLGLCLAS